MRDIKFRAWDGKNMVYPDDNCKIILEFNKISGWNIYPNQPNYKGEYLMGESQSKTPLFILMQYTGLKDKNGKEIFEGDIVQRNGHFYTVKYIGSSFVLSIGDRPISIIELMERYTKGSAAMFYFEDLEIIGNIYETPHLLHAQQKTE
jgi:hypothetical protein